MDVSLEEGELKDLRVVILEQIENSKIYGYAVSIKGGSDRVCQTEAQRDKN